jgi:hypothetical protein
VGLDEGHHHVEALGAQSTRVAEHGHGFTHARGHAQKHLEAPLAGRAQHVEKGVGH